MDVDELIALYGAHNVYDAAAQQLSPQRLRRIEDVLDARLDSLTFVLEDLYDPHNGAAALRSAEALGLQQVHVVEGPSGPFAPSPEVTMGCHHWLDVHRHPDVHRAIETLRHRGFVSVALVPSARQTLGELNVDVPTCLWLGNEKAGLSREAQSLCDASVAIPMYGFTQSLNLSVAVALSVAHLADRRRGYLGASGDLPAHRRHLLRARWAARGMRGLAGIVERYMSCGLHTAAEQSVSNRGLTGVSHWPRPHFHDAKSGG